MARRATALIVALAIAALGTAMIIWYGQGVDAQAAGGREYVEVVTATELIAPGESVRDALAADKIQTRKVVRSDLSEKLTGENGPYNLVFTTNGGTTFSLYETAYAGQAGHTIAQWHDADVADEVNELKAKGLEFEHYDMPEVVREGDVHVFGPIKSAWFKDPDGNIHALVNG